MIPSYQAGAIAYGGTEWFLVNWVPATPHNGTYTMIDPTDGYTPDELQKFHQYYGFTRAISDSAFVGEWESAGFDSHQILVSIGYNNNGSADLNSDWQGIVDYFQSQVLGYSFDEPSGDGGKGISASQMQSIENSVHAVGSKLWLDDYDTGVIPYSLSNQLQDVVRESHIWGEAMLENSDYIMCDADNAKATDGEDDIGCYVGEDYNEFQSAFTGQPAFNTIFTRPPYSVRNIESVVNWIVAHLGVPINTFAVWLPSGWTWADVDGFAQYAYQAGFLGQYQLLEQAKYVCLENNVTFVPTSSDVQGTYYGVLNNGVYTGPVDPSTSGATACWSIQTWVSQNHYQTVYAQ